MVWSEHCQLLRAYFSHTHFRLSLKILSETSSWPFRCQSPLTQRSRGCQSEFLPEPPVSACLSIPDSDAACVRSVPIKAVIAASSNLDRTPAFSTRGERLEGENHGIPRPVSLVPIVRTRHQCPPRISGQGGTAVTNLKSADREKTRNTREIPFSASSENGTCHGA